MGKWSSQPKYLPVETLLDTSTDNPIAVHSQMERPARSLEEAVGTSSSEWLCLCRSVVDDVRRCGRIQGHAPVGCEHPVARSRPKPRLALHPTPAPFSFSFLRITVWRMPPFR